MSSNRRRLTALHLFVLMGVMVIIALLLAPDIDYGSERINLTTYSAGPFGARGLYQTADRLGWPVARRLAPIREDLSTDATYLLLDPPISPGARETGHLLEAVRSGARLLLVPTRGTPLSDSLGVAARRGVALRNVATAAAGAPQWLDVPVEMGAELVPLDTADRALPREVQPLLVIGDQPRQRVVVASMKLGAGRVLLIADASFFANHRQRDLKEAVLAIRLLEWLEDGAPRRQLVFSEWHHGRGTHPSAATVLMSALTGTSPGRALLVLTFAGGILLVAMGVRPVAPEPPRTIERRSPFEHVGALSRAYEQIGATRLATRHLVRGLRRRRAGGVRTPRDEREYLISIRERQPSLAPQVELLLEALDHRLPPAEFVKVGDALHTIERTLAQ